MYHSYEEVCEELDRRRRITLGFERIEALLRLLGDPHRSLKVVQIVGTNGKGTTAIALASALEVVGRPTGAYLSPHVLSYTERVMLDGRYVSEEEFAAAMGKTIDTADASGVPATQFELLTAGALAMFRRAGLEWAVLEAGLGARHDATSAAEPEAVALTNIGLDHVELLGETIEEIAEEKLASLRPGAVLILGTGEPPVLRAARRAAERVGARVVEHKETGKKETTYLERNERFGMRAAEVMLGRSLRGEEREAASAMARAARPPGRFEVRELRGVPVVVDGGHNPEGIKAALEAVRAWYGDRPLGVVFGVLKEKDVGSMLNDLEMEADLLVLARPVDAGERALDPEQVYEEYARKDAGEKRALVAGDVAGALEAAVEEMKKVGGVVLITGSLYTGAEALRWLHVRR